MIARTYYVVMPSAEGGDVALDLVIEGFPGSQADPIDTANSPAGWNGGNGSYYEIRSRPVRFATGHAGDNGFVPLFNLGWTLSTARYNDDSGSGMISVELSESLQASLNATPLTDPSYGPVIRLSGPASEIGGTAFVVHLQIMQAKDEDRASSGT